MSLDDKFFPDDGSLINKFDNFFIKQASIIGEVYQNWTGNSYKDLTKSCYKSARNVAVLSCLSNPLLGLYSAKIHHSNYKNPKYITPLEEEEENLAAGCFKHLSRFTRITGIISSSLLLGVGSYILDNAESPLDFYGSIGIIATGMSFYPAILADYLSRSNLPKPPKKTTPNKIKEKVSSLTENPLPESTPRINL